MNIYDLASQKVTFQKVGSDEYHGPCPWCGGEDRFTVQPEKSNRNGYKGGRYICRGCGKNGDAIEWLKEWDGMAFPVAMRSLGLSLPDNDKRGRKPQEKWKPKPMADIPSEKWTHAAKVAHRSAGLIPDPFLSWRGITRETAEKYGLRHFVKGNSFQYREWWGLPSESNQKGNPKKVWVPHGVMIPFYKDGRLVRLRIRRDEVSEKFNQRYVVVSGSYTGPMIIDNGHDVWVIVESELDAILIDQEAGDLVNVAAFGFAQGRPDESFFSTLVNAEEVFVSLDRDSAGGKEWGFWGQFKNTVWHPTLVGKDPGEMVAAGISIRNWIDV